MYEEFYNLDRAPFDTTPDPTFFYMSDGHQEALAALVYGIDRRKGFISLTGEVGTGKTTVLRAYIESEHVKNTRIIYLFNPRVAYEDLLLMVLRELRVEIPEGETKRVDLLHRVLVNEYKNEHNVVLIVDEAQNIPPETLESMRMLSNLETSSEKLIQIVLCGQPELEDLLATNRLRQLRQRISVKVKLEALTKEEAKEYVRYRLRRAGGDDGVFTNDAIDWVVRYTGGNPRAINVLCDNALITGYGYQQYPISTPIVREIAKDFEINKWSKTEYRSPLKWLRMVGGALAIAGIVGIAYLWYNTHENRSVQPVASQVDVPSTADPTLSLREGNGGEIATAETERAVSSMEETGVEDSVDPVASSTTETSPTDANELVSGQMDTAASTFVAENAPDNTPVPVDTDDNQKTSGNDGVTLTDSSSAGQQSQITTTTTVNADSDSTGLDSTEPLEKVIRVTADSTDTLGNSDVTNADDANATTADSTDSAVSTVSKRVARVSRPVAVNENSLSNSSSGNVLRSTSLTDSALADADDTTRLSVGTNEPEVIIVTANESGNDVAAATGKVVDTAVAVIANDSGADQTSGETNDVEVDRLTLKEAPQSNLDSINIEAAPTNESSTDEEIVRAETATTAYQAVRIVQNGDRLWDMIKDVYGRVDDRIIAMVLSENPQLEKNGDSIFVGQTINFPEL